ncbi:MAG: hypothetical protein ACPGNV_00720 [Mangrovicoccus sp.]
MLLLSLSRLVVSFLFTSLFLTQAAACTSGAAKTAYADGQKLAIQGLFTETSASDDPALRVCFALGQREGLKRRILITAAIAQPKPGPIRQ